MHPADPPHPASPPTSRAQSGACDTHIHMLAAPNEHRLWEGRAEDPAEGLHFADFVARYRAQMEVLGISRTVLVQSILYGTDNAVTLSALEALGRDRARAIALVRDDVDEATLDSLHDAGAVGVRLNYVHGGVLTFAGAQALAPRLAARGMHIQMLINSHRHMIELADAIRALPVTVVLDHLGWPDVAAGPDEKGFETLRALVSDGAIHVKLSGIYRLAPPPYGETDAFVRLLADANPDRCLWGSDYPFVMLAGATSPDAGGLLDAFHRVVSGEDARRRILVDAPAKLYQF